MTLGEQVFKELFAILDEHKVPYHQPGNGFLFIEPLGPDTFKIEIVDDQDEISIFACNWHSHYPLAEIAVDTVVSLLTPFHRIVEAYDGEKCCGAWTERCGSNGWENNWTGYGKLFVTYQQAVIPVRPRWVTSNIVLDERGFPVGTILGKTEISL